MKDAVIPLANQNLPTMQSIDYRTYQYAFSIEDYKKMAMKGTILSCMAVADGRPIGFALWERGPRKKPGNIIRLGVVPSMRRRGVGTKMLDLIVSDLRLREKSAVRSILSQNVCIPDDPDDVTWFMLKTGFSAKGIQERAFFEYGRWEDGIIFEREI